MSLLGVKLRPYQRKRLEEAARLEELTLSEFVRRRLSPVWGSLPKVAGEQIGS